MKIDQQARDDYAFCQRVWENKEKSSAGDLAKADAIVRKWKSREFLTLTCKVVDIVFKTDIEPHVKNNHELDDYLHETMYTPPQPLTPIQRLSWQLFGKILEECAQTKVE